MKTAVIVMLAMAAGALSAPNPYQATPYKAPYNQDYKSSYNYDSSYDNSYGYKQPSYNDYSPSSYSYNQPSYDSYSYKSSYNQPSYSNDYKSSYNQPSYTSDYQSSYNQPSYNQPSYQPSSYQPSYNQPSYDSYSPSNYGYSQPNYGQSNYGYQSNYYQKSCAPLNSIKPQVKGKNVVAYVADSEVTVAYCGSSQAGNVAVFFVRGVGGKCAAINERGIELEESLTFSCNHQTGYWDLLAGSDTKFAAISKYDIICGSQGDQVEGCAGAGSDLVVFYPYNYGY